MDIIDKVVHNGGVYETKKYRYVIGDDGELKRCRLDYLGTDVMYISHYDAWQLANRKYEEVF